MNQWGPGWDTHPPINDHRPDDYRAESPGPYTSPPNLPIPRPRPPRYGWGTAITVATLVALFIIGLAVSASRDDEVVQIPNTVLNPTPPIHFTPQVHKPGPPVRS